MMRILAGIGWLDGVKVTGNEINYVMSSLLHCFRSQELHTRCSSGGMSGKPLENKHNTISSNTETTKSACKIDDFIIIGQSLTPSAPTVPNCCCLKGPAPVSYTHLTLPTNREV